MKHYKKTNFVSNMKVIRHSKQMSIPEFCKLLKIDSKRWSEVENGRLHPNELEINAAVRKFMIPIDKLMSGVFVLEIKNLRGH